MERPQSQITGHQTQKFTRQGPPQPSAQNSPAQPEPDRPELTSNLASFPVFTFKPAPHPLRYSFSRQKWSDKSARHSAVALAQPNTATAAAQAAQIKLLLSIFYDVIERICVVIIEAVVSTPSAPATEERPFRTTAKTYTVKVSKIERGFETDSSSMLR